MHQVAFRVDASPTLGTGHVARCRALAHQLRKRGVACRFVSQRASQPWTAPLGREGHEVDTIDAGDWQADAELTRWLLGPAPEPGSWLVVDHYGLDARWHRVLRSQGWRVLAIDDLADRPLAADALLDPAPTASAAAYSALAPARCELLLGPAYCLLREEFAATRARSLATPTEPGLVHLALGGTDLGALQARIARQVLQACPQVRLRVVAPAVADAMRELAREFPGRYEILQTPASVAQTMVGCEAALGAPGGMLWERFCLGLPCACISVSRNQEPVLAALGAAGWLLDLGPAASFDAQAARRFGAWLGDTPARQAERARLLDAVDGLGAARVADWMMSHGPA